MLPAECRRGSSPANPSKRATERVKSPLPVPVLCPHCLGLVELVENSLIYGCSFGAWPWAYRCIGCTAYVGLHPFTSIPLGTLATEEIRQARKLAKAAFNPLWQSKAMSRLEAYAWLSRAMFIVDSEQCHIGLFDVSQCSEVVRLVNLKLESTE